MKARVKATGESVEVSMECNNSTDFRKATFRTKDGMSYRYDDVELFFESKAGRMQVFDKGTPLDFDEEFAVRIMKEDEVTVFVDMHEGDAYATAWGCDLTYDYVKINADYRS